MALYKFFSKTASLLSPSTSTTVFSSTPNTPDFSSMPSTPEQVELIDELVTDNRFNWLRKSKNTVSNNKGNKKSARLCFCAVCPSGEWSQKKARVINTTKLLKHEKRYILVF